MVFLTYRSPMPPAPWAIPTAGECANDPEPTFDALVRQAMGDTSDDLRETLAAMERLFGKPSPRDRVRIARVLMGGRADG